MSEDEKKPFSKWLCNPKAVLSGGVRYNRCGVDDDPYPCKMCPSAYDLIDVLTVPEQVKVQHPLLELAGIESMWAKRGGKQAAMYRRRVVAVVNDQGKCLIPVA
jgi:hypothetical protein